MKNKTVLAEEKNLSPHLEKNRSKNADTIELGSEISIKNPGFSAINDENFSGTLRDKYFLEVERIKHEIGGLEEIRRALGMSQRKLCQLLLVDPSAWTRWNKTGAPPHIYQALHWLVQLKKVNPEAAGPVNMASRLDYVQTSTQTKIKEIESNVSMLERAVALASTVTPAAAHTIADTALIESILKMQEERFQKEIAALHLKLELALENNDKVALVKNKKLVLGKTKKISAPRAKKAFAKTNKSTFSKNKKSTKAKSTKQSSKKIIKKPVVKRMARKKK